MQVGKFYRFKPRNEWLPELRSSIPDDPMYYIHPVIVISITSTDQDEVVTCTTHPHPEKFGKDAYARVAEELTMMTDKSPRPRATTWVGLHTRHVYPKGIFCRFKSKKGKKGKKKQLALKQIAAVRLRELADEYEEKHGMHRSASTAASKEVNTTRRKRKTACTSSASTYDGSTTRTQRESDIQEIRASLSGIKQFVAAQEALCERMETNSHASHNSAETATKNPADMSTDPPNGEMKVSCRHEHGHVELQDAGTQFPSQHGSETTQTTTSSSRRSHISRWLRNVCRRNSSSSLSSS